MNFRARGLDVRRERAWPTARAGASNEGGPVGQALSTLRGHHSHSLYAVIQDLPCVLKAFQEPDRGRWANTVFIKYLQRESLCAVNGRDHRPDH